MGLGDDRGYEWFASIHSLSLPGWCEHGTRLFLPWHRAYLYYFELALQSRLGQRFVETQPEDDTLADVGIPWWDWTSTASHQSGIPDAYDAAQVNGQANPLAQARIASCPGGDGVFVGVWSAALVDAVRNGLPGTLTPDDPPRTRRDPDDPDELPRRTTIDNIVLQQPTFETFSTSLEQVHGQVHVWVGGTMSQVPTAGYDPIFWSHHSMVDRLWYVWQNSGFGEDPPMDMLDTVLTPFPMTVRQTLSINLLGYDYAVQVS